MTPVQNLALNASNKKSRPCCSRQASSPHSFQGGGLVNQRVNQSTACFLGRSPHSASCLSSSSALCLVSNRTTSPIPDFYISLPHTESMMRTRIHHKLTHRALDFLLLVLPLNDFLRLVRVHLKHQTIVRAYSSLRLRSVQNAYLSHHPINPSRRHTPRQPNLLNIPRKLQTARMRRKAAIRHSLPIHSPIQLPIPAQLRDELSAPAEARGPNW